MLCLLLCKLGDKLINNEQKIQVKINARNITHYKDRGYLDLKKGMDIDVSIKDLPLNSHEKINARCDICGRDRSLEYRMYIKNIESNNGIYICHPCSVQVRHNKSLSFRQDEYYDRAKKKCKENRYRLLSSKDEFLCNTSMVRYECPLHGEQQMRLNNFFNNRKCPECALIKSRERYQLQISDIIQRVRECGGEIINPQDYINNSVKNLEFRCQNCGETFISSFVCFTQHGGQLCKNCSGIESLGEVKIRKYLEENQIEFLQEHWFKECRDIKPLPFDFYLPEQSTIIEFDGIQHYKDTDYFRHSLEKVKSHDLIKEQYCKDNGINLIRIPYTKINHISSILDEQLVT